MRFASLVVQNWVTGINDVTNLPYAGIPAWLCKQEYRVEDDGDDLVVIPSSYDELLRHLAFDVQRFVLASMESDTSSRESVTDFPSWACIKKYYSSFFIICAITRMTGSFLAFTFQEEVRLINEVATLYGVKHLNGSGNRKITISSNGLLRINRDDQGGKAHEENWKLFTQNTRMWTTAALSNNSSSINLHAIAEAEQLLDGLSSNGLNNGSWLSMVRNDINYRHSHNIWFPGTDTRKILELKEQFVGALLPLNHGDNLLLKFVAICNTISAIRDALITELERRCSHGERLSFIGSQIRKYQRMV